MMVPVGMQLSHEERYIIVTDAVTQRKTPVSWDDVLITADLDRYKIITDHRRVRKPFSLADIRQHPGVECCDSCIEDAEYDSSYSLWPKCCCRSRIPVEWLEARLDAEQGER